MDFYFTGQRSYCYIFCHHREIWQTICEDGYREMGFNVLSVLYIEPYYWIRRIPLEITYLMIDVID